VADGIRVSIVITGKNVEKTIEKTIKSLLNQTFPRSAFEIIYVDGGSTDNTLEVVKKFEDQVKVYIFPNSTPGAGRNYGARYAKGEYLAFLDADCVAPKNWLSTLVTAIQGGKSIGAVGAALIEPDDSSAFNKLFYKTLQTKLISAGSAQFHRYKEIREVQSLPAGNFMTTKEIFNKLGGFSEDLIYCEDADFHHRLRRLGYKSLYVPNAEVVHLKTIDSLKDVAKYLYRWGCGRAQAVRKKKYLLSPIHVGFCLVFIAFIAFKIILLSTYLLRFMGLSQKIFYGIINIVDLILNIGVLIYIFAILYNSLVLSLAEGSTYYLRAFYIGLIVHISYICGFIYCLMRRGNKV